MTYAIMNSRATIDLTQDSPLDGNGQDLLSSLPPELLDEVISYLYPAHFPDRILFPKQDDPPCSHPLDFLAATNHTLRAAVNAWAHSFLLQHASITKYKPKTPPASSKPKSKSKVKTAPSPNLLRGRSGLLTWSEKHCVFCGKKSVRRAILANGLRCCDACDRKEWPGKITKTQAQRDYLLKESDLFIQMYPGGRTSTPGLLYGVYSCQGGHATMILEESLRRTARRKHGDGWEAEKDRRAAERQRKSAGDPNPDAWSELIWTKEKGLHLRPDWANETEGIQFVAYVPPFRNFLRLRGDVLHNQNDFQLIIGARWGLTIVEADISDAFWSGVSQWECMCHRCHASFIERQGLHGESGFLHLAKSIGYARRLRIPSRRNARFTRFNEGALVGKNQARRAPGMEISCGGEGE